MDEKAAGDAAFFPFVVKESVKKCEFQLTILFAKSARKCEKRVKGCEK